MPICTKCGRESADGFAFCPYCGAALAAAPGREVRKTVTVLFCDVEGSTALGESVDPEALRTLLARYFERLQRIVESHGGTVEKFVGDAVMAVFGIPVLHEDDALRAVRAAAEIRDALPELGVQARIGVNTGEVVTGTAERLATGDAVNVAARLERAAAAGEVLLGAETARRVLDSVDAEPVAPLELKGKSEPVAAYRLVAVREAADRRFDTPMVGRDRELRVLHDAFARAVNERSCQLVTLVAPAGVGKSRLAAEFCSAIDARVVRSRCLPYGPGITYRPVVELVNQLGIPSEHDTVATPLRALTGESEAATSADEIAWAARKLIERNARDQPLVWVVDDLHWAEPTFVDLVEHVCDLARDVPLLVLCISRPDLLERRTGWGGGKPNATTIAVEPLDAAETGRLIDALGGVSDELRGRIADAAEGNPLFVEEMVALVRESGDADVTVPPTIQALLAARLDQLAPGERGVLERGAIEGRVFHRGAVQALHDGGEPQLLAQLVALVRKDLIRPEPTHRPDDDAYRFRHVLIRDAAYEALPKSVRSDWHERLAEWLEANRDGLGDLDEIVGHHLEQAVRYRQELGRPDQALAVRAGERVAAAGRRALWRGDLGAAAALLERALELLRPSRHEIALELDLATAHHPVPARAAEVARAAAERAGAAEDRAGEAAARVVASFYGLLAGENGPDEVERNWSIALPLLEDRDDHELLAHVWSAYGFGVANVYGRYAEWAHSAQQALLHARQAGQRPTHVFMLDLTLVVGPTPADEAVGTLDAVLPELAHPQALLFRAQLLAMLGRFEEAWSQAREASERQHELTGGADDGAYALAEIASLEGDHESAARYLSGFCDFLEAFGQRGLLSTFAPMLGRFLCRIGRYDEAEPKAHLGRDLGDEHDVATQALWRQAQALVDAHRGDHAGAETLAREAVEMIEQTDALNFQGAALHDLGEVLAAAGRTDDAVDALTQALDRYERKRNVAAATQVQARLGTLQALPL